jgi:hypothetical protein
MACGNYEVGIFDPDADKMWIKHWTGDEVQKAVGFLKSQNAMGKHIYIRPAGAHALNLIDDLKPETVDRMKAEGYTPALVVETSPGNLQAWLAHGVQLPPAHSTQAAKCLAQRFGGDPSSADWRHFGRLAGFTNRKPAYQQANGHYPFVRIREATGAGYPQSRALVEEAAVALAAKEEQERQARAAYSQPRHNPNKGAIIKSIADFRNAPLYAGDYHRSDLAFATYALSRGMSSDDVASEIMTRDLSHKGNDRRQREYIERTLLKAAQNIQRSPER